MRRCSGLSPGGDRKRGPDTPCYTDITGIAKRTAALEISMAAFFA
jgi:hypothetical protein